MKALKTVLAMALAILVLAVSASAVAFTLPDPVAQTVNEGVAIDYTLPEATGAVGTVTYALTNMPTGADFDATPTIRKFTWTPDYSDAAVYDTMTYTATDSGLDPVDPLDDAVLTKSFTVTVNNFQPISIATSALLGGPDQKRSNSRAESDSEKVIEATTPFTITNNGGLDVVISGITSTADSKYNISFPGAAFPMTIAPGEVKTISIKGKVPEELDSFFADRSDRKNNLGLINIAFSTIGLSTAPMTSTLFMEAENQLTISKLYVIVNGESETVTNEEEVKDIHPGDKIEVKLKAENHYLDNDNEDLSIEDAEFTVEIDGDEFEVDETEEFSDIDPDTEEEETISFDLDRDEVEDDIYTMYVTLSGHDENGAEMGEKYLVKLDVEKEEDEVLIEDIDLSPDTVTCQKSAMLRFKLVNTGDEDQKEVAYKVRSTALNSFSAVNKDNIKLDSGDDYVKTVTIPLDNVKPGDYEIEILSYYNEDVLSDLQTATLHVEACPAPAVTPPVTEPKTEAKVETKTTGVESTTGSVITQPPVTIVPDAESVSEFQNGTTYMMLLGGLVVVLTIALVLLLIKFVF